MNTKSKNIKIQFKLNDNVEFLEKNVRNWRYGKIIEINNYNHYKIYSGTDIFWVKAVKDGAKVQLETF
jgi:hypothetical protein